VNGYSARFAAAAVLWTVSLALGVGGTVSADPRMRFWALMIALGAGLVSGHLIVCAAVKEERLRVERLIDGMIARAREQAAADLPKVH
jgi:hypothetical protein